MKSGICTFLLVICVLVPACGGGGSSNGGEDGGLAGRVMSAAGCACFEKDNRRVLNALDGAVRFESTAGKIAAAPVFVPVGFLAGAIDIVVVHPACSVPPALEDTGKFAFDTKDMEPEIVVLLFLPRLVLSPLYFVGSWSVRSLFDFD